MPLVASQSGATWPAMPDLVPDCHDQAAPATPAVSHTTAEAATSPRREALEQSAVKIFIPCFVCSFETTMLLESRQSRSEPKADWLIRVSD
jgi:hypothetical protein